MTREERLETIKAISGTDVSKCMKCGKCSASCPAYDEMEYHPHQFASMIDSGEIEALLASDSVYRCLGCFAAIMTALGGYQQQGRRRNQQHTGSSCSGGLLPVSPDGPDSC